MQVGRTNRRAFIGGLGTAAAWPVLANALDAASPVVGVLHGISFKGPVAQPFLAAFREGLASLSYVEGQNLRIEVREAEGHYDRLPDLAADIVKLQPDVLVGVQLPATLALKAATTTIPIVFTASDDPVKNGLVMSLRSPGGNATGINPMMTALEGKRLSLLHELVPDVSRIGALFNPNSPDASSHLTEVEAAGNALGLELVIIKVAEDSGLENAFAWINEHQIEALLVVADPLFSTRIDRVADLAKEYKVPAVYSFRSDAIGGGLMSYGPSLIDAYRQLGIYTGRVLKGEKPNNMPIWQTVKFELVINLKTAKAVDVEIPPTLLARADEVIE
ncbi:MAG: ABC transporter substrate-binding protein [Acidobacteria bacterium]|nr:MAG: ABC transporter substrate-binding protein [Acidobacteriota bacterium]